MPEAGWRLRVEIALNRMRWRVARSLTEDIGRFAPAAGDGAQGLAAAVTTSHQDWLPSDDADGLRGSGLAHMLGGWHTSTATVSATPRSRR